MYIYTTRRTNACKQTQCEWKLGEEPWFFCKHCTGPKKYSSTLATLPFVEFSIIYGGVIYETNICFTSWLMKGMVSLAFTVLWKRFFPDTTYLLGIFLYRKNKWKWSFYECRSQKMMFLSWIIMIQILADGKEHKKEVLQSSQ